MACKKIIYFLNNESAKLNEKMVNFLNNESAKLNESVKLEEIKRFSKTHQPTPEEYILYLADTYIEA